MKMKRLKLKISCIVCAILTFFLYACENQPDYYSGYEPSIIVEGEIELNSYPKVIITRNIPYYVTVDSADLIYLILRQAKVTVSDGTNSEILTLQFNQEEFPPFYYSGNEIKGQAGKTYYLDIEYGEKRITSTIAIPYPVVLDSVWFHPNTPGDSLGKISARLRDNGALHNYYKTYTKIQSKQTDFYPTLISLFDDKLFNGQNYTFYLSRGPESFLDLRHTDSDFRRGDTVQLKIATIDEACFKFWQGYNREVVNGANPFASSFHHIESNIQGDGKGIWGGYGSSVYTVINK